MFYLAGVGLAFFLTLLLFSKRDKSVADIILGCWLVVITWHLLLFYFFKEELYPGLLGFGIPLPLAHGPFLYWYTRALTDRNAPHKFLVLHLIPLAVAHLYIAPFLALSAEEKIFVFESKGAGYETFNLINSVAIVISGVLYILLSSLALRKHRQSIVQEFSSTEKINLQWLQYMIYWMGAIWIFVIMGNDAFVFGAAVLFIAFIGFFGIRQVGIFHSHSTQRVNTLPAGTQIEVVDEPIEKKKYQKSGLSAEDSENIHRQLGQMMVTEKIFRESELSLTELADRLNTQPNYLSQVINEREGKNFYDYINTLRIEEFKRLAASPDNRKYTLMGLAEASGFNSKSSFNRYFKKIAGQSPSEFMESISQPQN
jgi:AraC-like DNA-binding protein